MADLSSQRRRALAVLDWARKIGTEGHVREAEAILAGLDRQIAAEGKIERIADRIEPQYRAELIQVLRDMQRGRL